MIKASINPNKKGFGDMRQADKSKMVEQACRWGRMDKGVILVGKGGNAQGLLGNLHVELGGFWLCIPV